MAGSRACKIYTVPTMTALELRDLPQEHASRLAPLLYAMWHEARGEWAAAHAIAQDVETPMGAWVHAHLHRREGDLANAAYWYRRAGKPVAGGPLPSEWNSIAEALLAAESAPR